jgi:YVTN family beta-propeller protein
MARRSRLAGLVLLGLLEACGGGTPTNSTLPPQPLRRFAYVANDVGGVFAYNIDDGTGALTPVTPSAVGNGDAFDVVADGSARFAYSADCFSHEVSVYTINSASGALAASAPAGSAGNCPQNVAIHPTGKFLYVLAGGFVAGTEPTNPEQLAVFSIDPVAGALGFISAVTVGTGNFVQRLLIEPKGRFAYVTNGGLLVFSISQSSGVLTPVDSPPFVAGDSPFGLSADPSGKFLYVANASSNDLYTLSIDSSTGAVAEVARTTEGDQPFDVAVDPMGRFVYVTNSRSNSVSAFLVNPTTAALTSVAGSPFAAGSFPQFLAIDPSGKFLLVSNVNSRDVSAYAIDATTGALRQVSGSPFQARSPEGIAIVQVR